MLSKRGRESFSALIAISPDGERIASAGPTGEVFLWELKTGKLIRKLNLRYPNFGYDDEVRSLAYSPNSKLLAGTGLVRLVLWNAANGEVEKLYQPRQSGGARFVRFVKNGEEIAKIQGVYGVNDTDGRNEVIHPTANTWLVGSK